MLGESRMVEVLEESYLVPITWISDVMDADEDC